VELIPEILVFLRDGCQRLGYFPQPMRYGYQALNKLGMEGDYGTFGGECPGQRFWVEIL